MEQRVEDVAGRESDERRARGRAQDREGRRHRLIVAPEYGNGVRRFPDGGHLRCP
jgi:hypothetical protein